MALEEQTDDFDVVATNPAAYYSGPAEVFADAELTREQKLRILDEWEIDLKRALESDSEGMAQGDVDQNGEKRRSNEAALLRQVSNWLRRARGEDAEAEAEANRVYADAPSTVMGRVWHRLFRGGSKDSKDKIAA